MGLYTLAHNPKHNTEVSMIIIPILKVMQLRPTEIKSFAQDYRANKW